MSESPTTERLRRLILGGALTGLLVLLYVTLYPMLAALAWAVILAVSLWPLYERLLRRLPRPPGLAATLMVVLILLLIIAPLGLVTLMVTGEAARLAEQVSLITDMDHDDLVAVAKRLPLVGELVADQLEEATRSDDALREVVQQAMPMLTGFAGRLAGGLTRNVFKLAVCLFAAYFFFRHGESLVDQLDRALRRLSGARLASLVSGTRVTVRGVVYGLVLTAMVQGAVAAFGFWLGGVPYPLLLGVLTFILSFVPFGPPLVWIPAGVIVIAGGDTGWGLFVLAWGAGVVSLIDNVLRPLLIGQATRLPVLLVFVGVVGGIAGFGMVGLFVGPVVLALALALWREWIARQEPPTSPPSPSLPLP